MYMKKALSVLLAACVLISALLCGCQSNYSDPTDSLKVNQSTDKYRNFYEIFVGSFEDSNEDGIGDIPGIISKLDYLNDGDPSTGDDLGIDGIWLTPIMPSPSYHKYDVENYFGIDDRFGTLDDFDKLVKECHKRGIKLIIDMVLNHSSNTHPLFEHACKDILLKKKLNSDAKYFEIEKYKDNPGDNYTEIGNGYYYESNFSPHMPEWNLSAKKTREYFKEIAQFWLKEHDVDGFRLDATKYYSNKHTDGAEFLKWYYAMAQKIKPDVYMVGENWTGNAEIQEMYKTGVDSFFAFGFANSTGGFVNAVRVQNQQNLVKSLQKFERKTKANNKNAINSYFLSNHDQIRSANFNKTVGLTGTKMAAALYMLVPGNSYIYYGEEIGMTQDTTAEGDEYKRAPMIWDSENLPEIKVNDKLTSDESQAPYGGAAQQKGNKNSLLEFYKRIIKVKNQNPEIARGTITSELTFASAPSVFGYNVEYNGKKLSIIHNLSKTETVTVEGDFPQEIRAELVASNGEDENGNIVTNHVKSESAKLTLPPQSTVVLAEK